MNFVFATGIDGSLRRDILRIIELGHGKFHDVLPSRETVLLPSLTPAPRPPPLKTRDDPIDVYDSSGPEASQSLSSGVGEGPSWVGLAGNEAMDKGREDQLREIGIPVRSTQWLWDCISSYRILPVSSDAVV